MRAVVSAWAFAAALLGASSGTAQEGSWRFFETGIDLWGKPQGSVSARAWGDTLRLPDGTVAFRELPRELVRVLESPTRENVRAYLEWRLERARKILRAAELVREYRSSTAGSFRLTYFRRDGCPPCRAQDEVLAGWLREHPEVSLETLDFGRNPERWRAEGVRGTPTLVLLDPAAGKSVKLEGFSPQAALEQALAAVRPQIGGGK
jgi:hypothetical protein